jgi:hypothetical protein
LFLHSFQPKLSIKTVFKGCQEIHWQTNLKIADIIFETTWTHTHYARDAQGNGMAAEDKSDLEI